MHGSSLSIDEGEFIVLLGPSGCGKTTTLRMIAGLEIATGGRIDLAGEDVTALRPSRRDIGFVFQFYALYPHLTVRENLAFPLKSIGMPRKQREAEMQPIIERLGIGHLLDRKPPQLPGGDQQRVSLGRALVRRPKLWLMDEPLGQLDAEERLLMREFIKEQQQELGVTTVFVTHDQEEAMALADRVVVMSAGEIRQVGSPIDVYERPDDTFVAHFVGSPGMNMLSGSLLADGFRAGGESGVVIPLHAPVRGAAASLGVRGEYLHLDPGGPIPGTVVVDEYLGAWRNLHCDTPCGRLVLRAPGDQAHVPGDAVRISVQAERALLFDAAGKRVSS
ncbi:MAG: ABC transporter ATP-binding protein [Planctomycetota bacterium]|nr:ABC transporter ATP-binding protein [Planctomycetota bacterium]